MSINDPDAPISKLKPEFKAAWLKALRSGEYTQTYRALWTTVPTNVYVNGVEIKAPAGMCCLGVACALLQKAHPELVKWQPYEDGIQALVDAYGDTSSGIPNGAITAAVHQDPYTPNFRPWDTPEGYLPELNDQGKTFAEIADIIEKYL